ncbi:hypothetical protein H5410_026906 [Solanum commersonii]|uniref:Uncharacterized protein n=1 Tax=Solanum commersonii TaxID=4109 RepID=A0A9J5Z2W3_SOLCO|nr:hypothetical protein H5410_026906 [Solanum commersonii]
MAPSAKGKRTGGSSSSSGTSGIDINHPMYKDFLDFIKSKKEGENATPSNSAIPIYDENTEIFDLNDKKEVIFLLENSDLRWKNEPWQIMSRYLDTVSYTTSAYKYRMHYEIILSATGSCELQHFYLANTKKVLAPEEWGLSPLKEMDYIHPEHKVAVKYNYWDYIDGFNRALLYENANKKHSWFIKICSNIFERNIPNWFCRWWTLYGPSVKILPESYKKLYLEWVDISPKIINLQENNIFSEGMSLITFYAKFWSKLLQKNQDGHTHGHEILDLINVKLSGYYNSATNDSPSMDDFSPFKKITRKLQMKKGLISKSEAIAIYMEKVKRDLMKNLNVELKDDTSMASASHLNEENEETCLAGVGQNVDSDEEIDIEAILQNYQKQIKESLNANATGKGKEKV